VLTIKTAFRDFGITNLPRECGRLIERRFGVQLSRVPRKGNSRYGVPVTWYEYRLPNTDYNQEGRRRMLEYVGDIQTNSKKPATTSRKPRAEQISMEQALFDTLKNSQNGNDVENDTQE